MRHLAWKTLAAAALCAMTGASTLHARQAAPDLILSNGTIITVPEKLGKIVYDASAVTSTR